MTFSGRTKAINLQSSNMEYELKRNHNTLILEYNQDDVVNRRHYEDLIHLALELAVLDRFNSSAVLMIVSYSHYLYSI